MLDSKRADHFTKDTVSLDEERIEDKGLQQQQPTFSRNVNAKYPMYKAVLRGAALTMAKCYKSPRPSFQAGTDAKGLHLLR